MKTINCNDLEFNQIKHGEQNFKIFTNEEFKYLEEIELINSSNEKLLIKITAVNKYKSIDDILKIVDMNKFGEYKSKDEFVDAMNARYDLSNEFIVCRLKIVDDNIIIIEDEGVFKYIDDKNIEKITIGLSGCDVLKTKLKTNGEAILKIKKISSNDKLKNEYDVLEYLRGKINVAKNIYYNVYNKKEYLLRECIEGKPLYEFKNFGYRLGCELKKIHSLYNESIPFDVFSTDRLLEHVLDNIDIIYNQRGDKFENYTLDELKKFIIDNKPENDALIHGDFSLTNILLNNDDYYFIDLSGVSKSTKYFDIYVLIKSLKINNLDNELEDFLKGYGLEELNENALDWMRFIELSYS